VDVSFTDAVQVFNVGPAAPAVYGTPAGVAAAARTLGTMPLAALAAPAAALARAGVEVNREQAYLFEILGGIVATSPEARAALWVDDRPPRVGDVLALPDLADALERLGAEGDAPFYTGDIAATVSAYLLERGGALTPEDLRDYAAVPRDPVRVSYRGRTVLTNPPPSAGGVLIAHALARLEAQPGPPGVPAVVDAMEAAQAQRTPEFLSGLAEPGFARRFLGSTTHIAVLDAQGGAASVTCTNGEGSGVVVPGTGIHLSNMMGESDLSPLGFHTHPPGRRLPSMMAPTVVLAGERPELVLGSAGSNRIRSAILQVILGVLDAGLGVEDAVRAPRLHFEDGIVYAEPGVDLAPLEGSDRTLARFRERNLFFGGVQAVRRDPQTGRLAGAGDPRRGGVAAFA
jgi:gamma-glutamyltranspeptidase/glutathione hydrolase